MEFRILGPLEVNSDGQTLDLGGTKQRAVLAVLLLHANQVVSRDRLVEALWESDPPATAHKALQVHVSGLRKLLGKERLETRPPGYLLRIADDELDLSRFQRLREEGRLTEALALWRGPPLSDFAYDGFAQAEIARLQELYLACREERIEIELASGRHVDAGAELETLVADSPLRERLRGQLMIALYRSGRQAEALEVYQQARAALVGELGIEPSRELRELHQSILNQDSRLDFVPASAFEGDSIRGGFIGREAELAELIGGLEAAFAGRGGLFLLVGEPGIGKSRLADELIAEAKARGARVLIGRCWEAGGAPAYWPWVQSMRTYVHEGEISTLRSQLGAGAADLAQLLPELRELFADIGDPPSFEAESGRFRLFHAAAEFLIEASRARPLLLVLDDLHAADEPSLLLLQFLARELGDSRLLVVGAYRDVDPTPARELTSVLTELEREPVTRTLALGGLGHVDVSRFIEQVSGEAPSDELATIINDETEGNPLFIGEMVRLLAEEGGLEGEIRPLRIPQTVHAVIARRLGHLSDECNRVLLLACVLGREFTHSALARVAEVSEDALLETLDEAMQARVVSDVPGTVDRLRFAHVLIRDTLYEGLTTARRVRLHRVVVGILESDPAADPAELAHHAIAGSDFERGLTYARRAGDHALELLAYEEAVRLYVATLDALDLVNPDDDELRCDLLLAKAEASIRAGDSGPAKQTFLEAATLARRLGLARQLARAALGYSGRIVWARPSGDDLLVRLLEEALTTLDEADIDLRVLLLARLAGALRDEPTRERRDAISSEALGLARQSDNQAVLAYALDARAHAIIAPDTVVECLELSDELRDVARQTADPERLVAAHMLRTHAQLIVGDVSDAATNVAEASRIADELRQPVQQWLLAANRALLALATGELSKAEALMEEALPLGERAQPEHAIPHDRLQRYTLGCFRGDLDGIEPDLRALVRDFPARRVFYCAHANCLARIGQASEAQNAINTLATNDFAALPFDQEWLYAIALLADTCVLLGDKVTAGTLYRLAHPYYALNAVDVAEGFMGSISRYLALLALLLRRAQEARDHFEHALAMNERMGARPWLAYTQHDYARLLLTSSETGDCERAQGLLAESLATCVELGMAPMEAPGPTSFLSG
jgi:DNA-binding SARP family transcriptional activator/tetratricopeptide (TPR) repeat protein